MVLDVNTQVGDQYATTDVHLFEVHGKTAGWGLGLLLLLVAVTCMVGRFCRRRYRRKLSKHMELKAITHDGPPKAITYEGPPRAIAYEGPPRVVYPAPRAFYYTREHYPGCAHSGAPRNTSPLEEDEEAGTSQQRPKCTINM